MKLHSTDQYKIVDLIDTHFDGLPINLIDFKRHLAPGVALCKKIVKQPSGRPGYCEYYWDSVCYAKITFEFETDPNNLVIRRREILTYERADSIDPLPIVIKDRVYDPMDPVDGALMVEEREQARASIVSQMKSFLAGVVMLSLQKPMSDVIVLIKPYWTIHKNHIDDFIELGSPGWLISLQAIDLQNTPFQWMAYPINEHGTTVRDYMANMLSY